MTFIYFFLNNFLTLPFCWVGGASGGVRSKEKPKTKGNVSMVVEGGNLCLFGFSRLAFGLSRAWVDSMGQNAASHKSARAPRRVPRGRAEGERIEIKDGR